jgi:AcrR family transcriptional regulator
LKRSATTRSGPSTDNNRNSRDAILASALKAFASDGFDGASMPKIAKMAQVAPPLIHYYFGSKDNLWRETVAHSLGQLCREATAIREATRALAPLDRLRALMQAYTQFAARFPEQFIMIMAEARSESDRFAWVQANYTSVLVGGVRSDLEDAKRDGVIQDLDMDKLTFMMIGGILLYFTISPAVAATKDLDKLSTDYVDLMFNSLLHGIGAK